MARKRRLGALELEVMQVIWERGTATVRHVWEALYPTKKLAYTSVASIIKQIEEKGFLTHEKEDRTYVYSPTVEQEHMSRTMLNELIDGAFRGSISRLMTTLIQSERLTDSELEEIQRVIGARSQDNRDGH